MASVLVLEIIYFAKKLDVDKSIFIIAIAIIPLVSSILLLTFKKYGIWLEKYKEELSIYCYRWIRFCSCSLGIKSI